MSFRAPSLHSSLFAFLLRCYSKLFVGDSTDQEYEITADMMVHDLDDETTMEEEELLADKEEFNEDELSELQKVTLFNVLLLYTYLSETYKSIYN